MTADRRSSAEIERDVRETRARVSETLERIEMRMTPGSLLDEAIGMVSSDPRRGSRIRRAIAEDPLPLLLFGLAGAWLAWSTLAARPSVDEEEEEVELLEATEEPLVTPPVPSAETPLEGTLSPAAAGAVAAEAGSPAMVPPGDRDSGLTPGVTEPSRPSERPEPGRRGSG